MKNNPIANCDNLYYIEGLTLDGAETDFKKLACGLKALQNKLGVDTSKLENLKPGQIETIKTADMMYQIEVVDDKQHFIDHPEAYDEEDLLTESSCNFSSDYYECQLEKFVAQREGRMSLKIIDDHGHGTNWLDVSIDNAELFMEFFAELRKV